MILLLLPLPLSLMSLLLLLLFCLLLPWRASAQSSTLASFSYFFCLRHHSGHQIPRDQQLRISATTRIFSYGKKSSN